MEPQRSVSNGFELTPDLLATHGRALRGLARSLLGDAHAAEDVVQETWLACLRHPGALPERVSAWLGTVTKHLALHRLRGEGRRALRERRAAAPERLEELQQRALEREEALRVVTQALLALEEPYKTALLLRYYEDRSPGEIAGELALPVSTVKSRLARGLDRMRSMLGTEFAGDDGRRTRALAALAGVPLPSAPLVAGAAGAAAKTVGALALATKLQAAAAAAGVLLAAGAAWWWHRAPEVRSELAVASEGSTTESAAAEPAQDGAGFSAPSLDGQASPAGARREAVDAGERATAGSGASPAGTTFPYRVTGQVRDEHDLPLAGARVFLGPRGLPLNRVATTDGEGRFTLLFDARRQALDCAFTVDDGGERMLGLCELSLVSGQGLVVDVGLNAVARSGGMLGELRTAAGALVLELGSERAPLVYSFEGETGGAADVKAAEEAKPVLVRRYGVHHLRATDLLDRAPEAAVRKADGRLLFVDPALERACSRALAESERATMEVEIAAIEAGQKELVEIEAKRAFDLSLGVYKIPYARQAIVELERAAEPRPAPASLRGVVRDALGNPLQGVGLAWTPHGGKGYNESAVTREDGAFLLEDIPPGAIVVRAGGGDHGRARSDVTLAAGEALEWNPVLDRGDEVTGRVVLREEANSLAGVLVELWSVSPTLLWCDATHTDDAGRFAIPNVPAGALELHVYASGVMNPRSAFPIRVVRSVFAPADVQIVLDVGECGTSSLALTLLEPDGEALPGAEVRVWQSSTGRGSFAGEPDETGKLALDGLPHGAYRVEAGGPFGWRDLGTVWVDEDTELAPERFAPATALELEADPAGGQGVRASLWSVHPDVFAWVGEHELGRASLMLRAGAYALCAAAGEERASETALELEPGAVTAYRLAVSSPGRIVPQPSMLALDLDGPRDTRCSSCHATAKGGF
jgi:RNA polymerase sigma-70 factor (ECF subfamily)